MSKRETIYQWNIHNFRNILKRVSWWDIGVVEGEMFSILKANEMPHHISFLLHLNHSLFRLSSDHLVSVISLPLSISLRRSL